LKVNAVRALGAKVVFAGLTSLDRLEEAERIQQREGGVIIPPFDDPHIIAGQGTATLELLEEVELTPEAIAGSVKASLTRSPHSS
jgi:threonine dehydratase